MDKEIVEYLLVSRTTVTDLNGSVNLYLKGGWELYGYPSVCQAQRGEKLYQAMVKYTPHPELGEYTRVNSDV